MTVKDGRVNTKVPVTRVNLANVAKTQGFGSWELDDYPSKCNTFYQLEGSAAASIWLDLHDAFDVSKVVIL